MFLRQLCFFQIRSKVLELQRAYRCHREMLRFKQKMAAIPLIKCTCQVYRAKQIARQKEKQMEIEFDAVLSIQRLWYVKNQSI